MSGIVIDNIVKGEISTSSNPDGDTHKVVLRITINGEKFEVARLMERRELLRMDKSAATKLIADALSEKIMERFRRSFGDMNA